ncbi:MAG: putative short chain dehydrogenase [Microbacteriaceae bacterium]|nr:putative short chain dehydrogenase [Microbacteriaceae bacterium]
MRRTDFHGGVAVITGAASGIGRGLAIHAGSLGMRVALADVSDAELAEVARYVAEAGGTPEVHHVDVRDYDQVDALAKTVFARWGQVDVLFNNAGIQVHGLSWEVPADLWRRVVDVNLMGVFHGVRAFIPRMIASGHHSHVVNTSSIAALGIFPFSTAYGATKHGNLALTEALALEIEATGIDVVASAVIPSAVDTAIFEHAIAVDTDGHGHEDNLAKRKIIGETGITPAAAAATIFEGASQGLLFIHTHPEDSREFWAERAEKVSTGIVDVRA